MNQYLAKAYHDYTSEHENFEQLLSWHLCHGVVLCWSDVFAMGYYSDSNNPEQPVERHHADTLFVTYCAGDILTGLSVFQNQFDFISYRREFKDSNKLRLFDVKQFYSKLK
jgi:hypothetical protein